MRTTSTDETSSANTLVIACGAIAHELMAVAKANCWQHLEVQCLPAKWHNTPHLITPAIEKKILHYKDKYRQIFIAYADCGTGGLLDSLLEKHGIQRLPGDHCYHFFAGRAQFDAMADAQLGTFYLTDYLAEHFQQLIMDGLGITRYPELKSQYFAHYTRLVYLQQDSGSPKAKRRMDNAETAALALGLPLEVVHTGLAHFSGALSPIRISVA